MNERLLKEGPKPSGCPLLMARVAAIAGSALLLIWLVTS